MARRRASREDRRRRSGLADFLGEAASPPAPEASQALEGEPQARVSRRGVGDQAREVVERLPPSQMTPDRFQPRPVLPLELQGAYFGGEADCYQAAAAWLELADRDRGHRERVAELIALATTTEAHGQINPVTGYWRQEAGDGYVFQIETGERRFWGAVLKAAAEGAKREPLLRIEAIERPSRERQVIENRHAKPPNAVARAREVAALVLSKLGIEPDPAVADTYDYFRQALNPPGRQRFPKGFWDDICGLMQLTDRRVRQLIEILRLPTPLLELADRHNLPARVLEAVVAAEQGQWRLLVEAAVADELTSDEVERVASKPAPRRRDTEPITAALRGIRSFARSVSRVDQAELDRVMDELADEIALGDGAAVTLGFIELLARRVRARLDRM